MRSFVRPTNGKGTDSSSGGSFLASARILRSLNPPGRPLPWPAGFPGGRPGLSPSRWKARSCGPWPPEPLWRSPPGPPPGFPRRMTPWGLSPPNRTIRSPIFGYKARGRERRSRSATRPHRSSAGERCAGLNGTLRCGKSDRPGKEAKTAWMQGRKIPWPVGFHLVGHVVGESEYVDSPIRLLLFLSQAMMNSVTISSRRENRRGSS